MKMPLKDNKDYSNYPYNPYIYIYVCRYKNNNKSLSINRTEVNLSLHKMKVKN